MDSTPQDIAIESTSDAPMATEILWITDDLVAMTHDVWSRHIHRRVNRREAVEILLNVQSLAMAFHMSGTESESPE